MPDFAVSFVSLCVELVDCQAHVAAEGSHSLLEVLDALFLQALNSRVIAVEDATQTIKVSHWGVILGAVLLVALCVGGGVDGFIFVCQV